MTFCMPSSFFELLGRHQRHSLLHWDKRGWNRENELLTDFTVCTSYSSSIITGSRLQKTKTPSTKKQMGFPNANVHTHT